MLNGVLRGHCFIDAIGRLPLFALGKWTTISDTTTSHTLRYYITEAIEKATVRSHRTAAVSHQKRRPEFASFPPQGKFPNGVLRGRCFINAIG
jgi:hypothetical protein